MTCPPEIDTSVYGHGQTVIRYMQHFQTCLEEDLEPSPNAVDGGEIGRCRRRRMGVDSNGTTGEGVQRFLAIIGSMYFGTLRRRGILPRTSNEAIELQRLIIQLRKS